MRHKQLPLTETVFYILLALLKPAHGYLVMQQVEALSNGAVRIAAGTLYGAFENLLKLEFIESVPSEDKRRKVYQTTELGREMLYLDVARMEHMTTIAKRVEG